jgi:NTP pyrophosphatase (non-canonical NTP hydrolase)
MEFRELEQRALAIRRQYASLEERRYGRAWAREEIALGFVGDVGDLMKLALAQEGVRAIPDAAEKLAHELADCLWSLLVLADAYEVDLQQAFLRTMDELEAYLAAQQGAVGSDSAPSEAPDSPTTA